MRREQIAFHPLGEEFEHLARRALLLAAEPLSDPGREPRSIERPDVDYGAKARERVEPRGSLSRAIEPRQRDEQELIRTRPLAVSADGFAALRAGLSIG